MKYGRDLRVEISVVPPPDPAYWRSRVERRPVGGTIRRNVPRKSVSSAPWASRPHTRAVARWDGNVALQRWGCGRCRPRDGGRGYRFTARRSSDFRISGLLPADETVPFSLGHALATFFSGSTLHPLPLSRLWHFLRFSVSSVLPLKRWLRYILESKRSSVHLAERM